jgi:hypothetical protein
MSDLNAGMAAINADPADRARWSALAAWYADHGQSDEADAVRVLWRSIRACMESETLPELLRQLDAGSSLFGSVAREIEAGRGREA